MAIEVTAPGAFSASDTTRSAGSDPEWSEGGNEAADEFIQDEGEALSRTASLPPPPDPGSIAEVHKLYRPDRDSYWQEWAPDNESDSGFDSYFDAYAVVTRYEGRRGQRGSSLHSIVVNSPILREALEWVFEGYEGISTKVKSPTFYAPFFEFYYRWHRFQQAYQSETDAERLLHWDLLYKPVSQKMLPLLDQMQDHTANGLVTFDNMWTVFAPGMDIYSKVDNQDRLFKLSKAYYSESYGQKYLALKCKYVDCDGEEFGYSKTTLSINEFAGVINIVDLSAFPSHLHPQLDSLLDRLHKRGKKFEELKGVHHVSYRGFYDSVNLDRVKKHQTRFLDEGRIMVDPKLFVIHTDAGRDDMDRIQTKNRQNQDEEDLQAKGLFSVIHQATKKAFDEMMQMMKRYDRDNLSESTLTLSTEQRLVCIPTVRGYCLASKKWGYYYVENIEQIQWNTEAFSRLVLPPDYKHIIYAFVQEQLANTDTFDDIIQAKGQGFIMLLSGAPGVGKTLTAESVSEEMQKPLYYMSAGELGETAREVDESFERVLELTTKWGAILLIDECDIFLEERSIADIQRNRLVSIFLKQLEYYCGVMFLTTNRVTTFDPAFESRIHLTLDYPELDEERRLHIWQTFVRERKEQSDFASQITEAELQAVAKLTMNGRQIKNVVKAARLLAKQEKTFLLLKHLNMVLKVKFGKSISDVSRYETKV